MNNQKENNLDGLIDDLEKEYKFYSSSHLDAEEFTVAYKNIMQLSDEIRKIVQESGRFTDIAEKLEYLKDDCILVSEEIINNSKYLKEKASDAPTTPKRQGEDKSEADTPGGPPCLSAKSCGNDEGKTTYQNTEQASSNNGKSLNQGGAVKHVAGDNDFKNNQPQQNRKQQANKIEAAPPLKSEQKPLLSAKTNSKKGPFKVSKLQIKSSEPARGLGWFVNIVVAGLSFLMLGLQNVLTALSIILYTVISTIGMGIINIFLLMGSFVAGVFGFMGSCVEVFHDIVSWILRKCHQAGEFMHSYIGKKNDVKGIGSSSSVSFIAPSMVVCREDLFDNKDIYRNNMNNRK